MRSESCDVLVIGGGPAGSTAGNLLARAGRRVIVLERERFPRFHIGESMLPATVDLFDELGVRDAIERIGSVHKYGAKFVTGTGDFENTIYFDRTLEPSPPMTYQVVRAEFDQVLLDECARRGADVRQEQAATAAERGDGEWRVVVRPRGEAPGDAATSDGPIAGDGAASGADYEIRCPFLIDASGRDTFMAQRDRSKRMAERHRRIAIYAHFSGALLDPGKDAGNIIVVAVDQGWFWLIPLARGAVSIGLVIDGATYRASKLSPEEALEQAMRACPEIRRRTLESKRLSPVYTTSNYSYRCDRAVGDGYLLVGDAYAFLDPIFSSGVWLAMNGARSAAEVVGRCLDDPARAPRLLARYAKRLRRTNSRFWRFVEYYYRPEFLDVFMQPTETLQMRGAVANVLAGTSSDRLALRARLWLFFIAVRLQRYMRMRPKLERCRVLSPAA